MSGRRDDPGNRETDARETADADAPPGVDGALRRIGEALRGLRFGSVLAIVQDGVVVQIERTEKTRPPR
jgi:hypothetical protein